MTAESWKFKGRGPPLPGIELKLVENPDIPFKVGRCCRGDIPIRGQSSGQPEISFG